MERDFDPKLTWNSSRDDIINKFYRPALSSCKMYQRLAGYFSSSTFANVANEILDFIESSGRIQLITSPRLSESDKKVLEQSVLDGERLLSTIFLDDLKNDPDNLKLEFSKLMAYMLTNHIDDKPQLEIKIAIPSAGSGIYHQKIGILWYENGEKIAFSGSVNETGLGWYDNIENFTVFRSWGDDTNNQGIMDNQREFNDLWSNNSSEVRVFDLPHAVKEHMLKIRPESDRELQNIMEKIRKVVRDKTTTVITSKKPTAAIVLKKHQTNAINEWTKNNFRGLLNMATGTGKTFTAFGCINSVQKLYKRTVMIIACPQLHLVDQWGDSLARWNLDVDESEKIIIDSQIICNSDNPNWKGDLDKIIYDFNVLPLGYDSYIKNNVTVFVTHDTLALSDFTDRILQMQNIKKFLIVDEVHNITEKASQKILLEEFDFRLGLSATPVRHLDEQGTSILQEYFSHIVYTLNLEKAIELDILCPYKYLPYYVHLTHNEMEEYQKLTGLIAQIEEKKRKGTYHKKSGDYDPYLARAALIANAENKYGTLESILDNEFNNMLSDTLIYCTNNPSSASLPNSPKQLERVKNILSRKGIISDSITWEDKTKDRRHIIDLLTRGHFNCLTAVGCLDEGVDIPSVKTGIFMASSGNPKQFIQRRGRILRKDDPTGKTHAVIYDILVAPPISGESMFGLSQRKLMAKELIRHKEFASIASNKEEAIQKIREIAEMFDVDIGKLSYDYIRNMT